MPSLTRTFGFRDNAAHSRGLHALINTQAASIEFKPAIEVVETAVIEATHIVKATIV